MKWIRNIIYHFSHLQPDAPEISDLSLPRSEKHSRVKEHKGKTPHFSNLGLLTKESITQYKSRWTLFLFFLLFLILSMAIITGLIHFTYSFGHESKKFDSLDRYTSLNISNEKFEKGENDIKDSNDQYSYSYFLNNLSAKYDKKEPGAVRKAAYNSGNVSSKDKLLYDDTANYYHNIYSKWLWEDFRTDFNNQDEGITNDFEFQTPTISGGLFGNNKVKVTQYTVGPQVKNNKDKNGNNLIYDWEIRKDNGPTEFRFDKSMRGFSLQNFDAVKNANDVIVTPEFLKMHHLKIGRYINILESGQIYRVRIAATGLKPKQTVGDLNDQIAFNPVIYNKLFRQVTPKFGSYISVISPSIPNRKQKNGIYKVNAFYSHQYDLGVSILSKSFNDDTVYNLAKRMTYARTPIKSYHVQLMMYNLFSWVVTAILIALLIVSYRFIQSLIVRASKPALINMRSMGFNKTELGYFTGISFLPVLIIGSAIGLAIGELFYYFMGLTLGHAIGFNMGSNPSSKLGYVVFACIFVGMLVVGSIMAMFSTANGTLSIHSKYKLSNFKIALLKLKDIGIFKNSGFSNVVYSFQVSNLMKAFSAFIVTILSFTVLGASLQFMQSVGGALNNKAPVYEKKGNSLSYRENQPGQINNSNIPIDKFKQLTSTEKLEENNSYTVAKDTNPYQILVNYAEGFNNKNNAGDISMHYLDGNQINEIDKFYKANEKTLKNDDPTPFTNKYPELKNYDVYNYLVQMDGFVQTYRSNFGKKAKLPNIFFHNRPKTEDFINYTEIHNAEVRNEGETLRLYDSNGKYKLNGNSIVVNGYIEKWFNVQIGDTITLNFKGIPSLDNTDKSNEEPTNVKLKIVAADPQLYNQGEAIVNFNAIRKEWFPDNKVSNKDRLNAVVSKSGIPYDIQNFVIPLTTKGLKGNEFSDYFPDVLHYKLLDNIDFTSIPVIKKYYMQKTLQFRNFATMISVLLILVCLCIVLVISILIAYENKQNILVLKSLGYSLGRTMSLFTIIYAIGVAAGYVASIFIAGALIDRFTGMLIQRLGLALTHMYVAETILVPLAIGFVFFGSIAAVIAMNYKKSKVQDITFAE